MIDVSDLTKSYGPVEALRGVSFQVDRGEIIGLLGPNGAGKTTIMKILAGYLQPSSGSATVDGLDVLTQSIEVQKVIGYLPENAPLYPELSVQAYLKMVADLRQVPEEEQQGVLSYAVRSTGLEDHLTRPIGQLSKGYRQRVGLAQAIQHRPKVLILDEPTIGLDPTQLVEVRNLIRHLAQDSTVLLSTHILSEVEAVCDRAIILLNGEVRADASLVDLEASTDVILVLPEDAPDVTARLQSLPNVRSVGSHLTDDGRTYRIEANGGPKGKDRASADLRPLIFDLARTNNWELRELRRDTQTLENVFNELATAAGGDEE
jgi:ABC-2 type transport system ATP-binding protein